MLVRPERVSLSITEYHSITDVAIIRFVLVTFHLKTLHALKLISAINRVAIISILTNSKLKY